ncbi:MAG TPA: YitT family protein [Clostridiaceae bacterium]|nr:YitT family protein [Clostridiaceae bacterium]
MFRDKRTWKSYVLITLGCLITAISMNVFLIPFKLAPGGVSGLSTVVYYILNGVIPVGILMLVFNIPLFLLGYKSKGRRFIIRSLFGAIILSLLIDLTAPFFNWLINEYFINLDTEMANPDLLLYALLGGGIMGFGLAIVLKEDATTGGTDLLAAVLGKMFPKFSVGQYLLFMDGCVIVFAIIAFKSVKLGLYASLSLYVASKSIDAYLEGMHFSKSLLIISENSEKIAQRLLNEVDRGVTGLKGIGMYSRKDKTVLLCVVKREEIHIVKEIVKDCDERAFVLLIDVREVLGEGFTPLQATQAGKNKS